MLTGTTQKMFPVLTSLSVATAMHFYGIGSGDNHQQSHINVSIEWLTIFMALQCSVFHFCEHLLCWPNSWC